MERILPLERGINLRELGGYETEDGRHVRWHKLMRSGHLGELSEADEETLRIAGLRQVVDLREEAETIVVPDRSMRGVHAHHMSVYPFTTAAAECWVGADSAVKPGRAESCRPSLRPNVDGSARHRCLAATFRGSVKKPAGAPGGPVSLYGRKGPDGGGRIFGFKCAGREAAGHLTGYMLTNLTFSSLSPSELNGLLVPGQDAALANELNKQPMVSEQDFKVMELTVRLMTGDFMTYLTNIVGITPRQVERLRELYLE